MSDSLIEQVKLLAEAQKECDSENDDGSLLAEVLGAYGNGSRIMRVVNTFFIEFDFPALLAHMQAQQAVVDAAREARRQDDLSVNPPEHALVTDAAFDDWFQQRCVDHEKAYAALDAALEKVNDHEQ